MMGTDETGRGESQAREGKGNGKGKEKEAPAEAAASVGNAETASAPKGNGRSILSRIADSAAGLGSSLMSGHPHGDDLASATSSEKAGTSGHGGQLSSSGEGSASYTHRAAAGQGNSQGAASAFRSEHVQEHIAQQEAEFSRFLDDTSVFVPTEPLHAGVDSLPALAPDANSHVPLHVGEGVPSSAVATQERLDGLEVVDLLVREGEEFPDFNEDIGISETDTAALRRALFGGDGSVPRPSAQDWDNMLNFIPEFVRPDPEGYQASTSAGDTGAWKSAETYSSLGIPHSPEASRMWIEQWQDVLTRYTDEVWGDLAALVREAQEELSELEKAEPEKPAPNGGALQRLRLILGHLRDT